MISADKTGRVGKVLPEKSTKNEEFAPLNTIWNNACERKEASCGKLGTIGMAYNHAIQILNGLTIRDCTIINRLKALGDSHLAHLEGIHPEDNFATTAKPSLNEIITQTVT